MPRAPHPYSVHPGVAMIQKWIEDLPAKTGRSFEEWIKFIQREGPKDEKARRAWLKERHGLGANTAWWLAEKASGKTMGMAEDTPEGYLALASAYVDEQYAGKKAHLRPLYDTLLKLGLGMGADARACPCKTIVPLYREHVFAQISAPNQKRVDLALCFKNAAGIRFPKRLVPIKNDGRLTHRIEVESPAAIDDDLKLWFRRAYDHSAPKARAATKPARAAKKKVSKKTAKVRAR